MLQTEGFKGNEDGVPSVLKGLFVVGCQCNEDKEL